jgi:uroporphyrinogen-III decarboxylase
MTSRERLLRTLRREKTDRVPIAPFLYYNNVYEMFRYKPRIDNFYDPEDFDPIQKFVDYCDHFGFDVLHTLGTVWGAYTLNKSGQDWDVRVTFEASEDEGREIIAIRTPGGDLRQRKEYRRSSTYLIVSAIEEHLIKTKRDFEILARYAPPLDNIDCRLVGRAAAAIGNKGLVVAQTHGAFNVLNQFRKLEDVMTDAVEDTGFYRAMMEYFVNWQHKQNLKQIQAGADAIEITGNMATSAVGPRFFEKYVLDYENFLAKGVHEAGAFTVYHNCGDAAKIMHLYNRMDIDVWGYLTPPPFGDVDLDQALCIMRPDMVLRGNIDQVEFMNKATPAEVRNRVKEVLLKVKPRGNWTLSTTDFFFDGTPYENIRAFAEAGREFGAA